MKKIAIFLGFVFVSLPFSICGCSQSSNEDNPWKDQDNLILKVISMLPNEEKVLDQYIFSQIDHSDENIKTYTFQIPYEDKAILKYPFSKVELYYKGQKLKTYKQFTLSFLRKGDGSFWKELDVEFGTPISKDIEFNDLVYCCFWKFYEKSNPQYTLPDKEFGTKEGINLLGYGFTYKIIFEFI